MRDWKALVRAQLGSSPSVDAARAADIIDEIAEHVAQHHHELVTSGVADRDAVEHALAPLAERAAMEIARADRPRSAAPVPRPARGAILSNVVHDLRYAIRLLRHAPGFAAAAILTLALGIGANAAIFSIVRAVALRPPPYQDPARVIAFLNSRPGAPPSAITSSSFPDYEDWHRQLASFNSLGILAGWTFNITGVGLPERVFGARVSGSLFPLLGTPALLGRTIEPDDDRADTEEVIVLGYGLWQRLFAADPSVIGQSLMMEGRPHVVIGIMPPRFRFPSDDIEMWAAIKNNMPGMPRGSRFMAVVGRLKPQVALASAQAEIDAVSGQLDTAYPESNRGWRVHLSSVQDATVSATKPALLMLAGAVGFVLLIASANVSHLLLARTVSRRRETAIRIALGASIAQVTAQWLTESLLLSFAGGTLGVVIAWLAVPLVVAFGPADVPHLDETTVDGAVLLFAFLVATAAGLFPILTVIVRAISRTSTAALKDGFGGYSSPTRQHGGDALIVAEVAFAMTLAVAGALLLKSFTRLTSVALGFDVGHGLSFKVFLGPPRYQSLTSEKQYVRDALARMATLPGIEGAAAVSQLPLSDPSSEGSFDIEGRVTTPGERPSAGYRVVSPNYFELLRIPIVLGRGFADDDRESSLPVVAINEAAARRFWPGSDPIGQRISFSGVVASEATKLTVVGIVADVKSNGLDKPEAPALYAPYTQRVFPWLRWNTFVVRTRGNPTTYERGIREELTKVDPMQPIYQVASLDAVVARSVATQRFHTSLIDLFAALALALCSVGVYGTINYRVGERTREIGVRMALGATRLRVQLMVVSRAVGLSLVGIAAGVGLSLVTGRTLSTLLYAVRPSDPETIALASLTVLVTAAGAAWFPARRASTFDPLSVIRSDG
jgi:putative ABC transport system permease protein